MEYEKVTPIRRESVRREGLGRVFKDFTSSVSNLARKEVELAKAEMSEKVNQAERGAVSMITSGVVVLFGIQFLLAAITLALATVMPGWVAALIVGIVVTAVGAYLFVKGRNQLKPSNLAPDRTIESVREAGVSAKEKWHGR